MILLSVQGQKVEQLENIKVSNTTAVYFGKTSRISELNTFRTTSAYDQDQYKKNKQKPPNFIGRGKSKVTRPELEHQGIDPVWQKVASTRKAVPLESKINIEGLTSGSPNDPTGSVGPDHYVQAINATSIGVYDKRNGTLVGQFTGNSLWEPIGESSRGDPIIVYDHEYEQWIITEFADPANLLIAVSEDSDPMGSYHVYSFSTPFFPDYPKYAIWGSYFVVTTNETQTSEIEQYFFDRHALMSGADIVTIQRVAVPGNNNTEAGFYVITPVHWNGSVAPVENTPVTIKINDSSWGEVEEDVVEVFTFDVDLANPVNTSVTKTSIVTSPFDSYPCDTETGGFACLAQGGESNGLDAIPEVIMNIPNYRNFGTHESMVFNFITDVTDGSNLSGIRWVELRKTDGTWTLYQEGTYAPDDGLHRFMGSIAIDVDGNIGLAYIASSSTEPTGIRFTGRLAEDPLGEMTFDEAIAVDGSNGIATARFGDYPHMTLDQVDGRTFWYTAEYGGNGTNNSTTRIFSFQVEKNEFDLEVASISGPETSSTLTDTESVTVEVINIGDNTASAFDLELSVDDQVMETYNFTGDLAVDETLEHTFGATLDLSAFGEYVIKTRVIYAGDLIAGNDTRTIKVEKLASLNGAIAFDSNTLACSGDVEVRVKFTNAGTEVLTSADLAISVGGALANTINWTGSLESNESEEVIVWLNGLAEGANEISVVLENVNGATDEVAGNNEINQTITVDSGLEEISLSILTDFFPGQTAWQITEVGSITPIYSGGSFEGAGQQQQIDESFCLQTNTCYKFIIQDSGGDGICCNQGTGSYSITSPDSEIIFSGNGEFGGLEMVEFCLGNACNLSVEVESVDAAGSQLGSIVVTGSGSTNYMYSIDGGVTYQSNPVFDALTAGTYQVAVLSQNDCTYEEEVTIGLECQLEIGVTSETTGQGTGTVEVLAAGGRDYEYSIDGGITFSSFNVFENVASGSYDVVVRSNDGGCTKEETVVVDFVLGTSSIEDKLIISPNPTNGLFSISLNGHHHIKGFLHVNVLDINGRIIQQRKLSRYDGVFQGSFSLYAYPDGVYFLRIADAGSSELARIVKK